MKTRSDQDLTHTDLSVSDETLYRYLLSDGMGDAERDQLEQRWRADREVRQRLQTMQTSLAGMREALRADCDAQQPDAFALTRWQQALGRAAAREEALPQRRARSWFLGFALVAALAWVVWPLLLQDAQRLPAGVLQAGADDPGMRVFADYATDARNALHQMPASERDDSQDVVKELLLQHQWLEQLAIRRDRPDVARLLRAMQPLLVSLIESPSQPQHRAAAIAQLEFEYGALLTKAAPTTSHSMLTTLEQL